MKTRACTAPLYIALKPSISLSACIAGMHACALASTWLSTLPAGLSLPVSVLLLVHALFTLGRCWFRPGFVGIGCDAQGEWWLESRTGRPMVVRIAPGTVVLSPLVLLSCRCQQGRSHHLTLPRDSMSGDDMRRLRQRLRTGIRQKLPRSRDSW